MEGVGRRPRPAHPGCAAGPEEVSALVGEVAAVGVERNSVASMVLLTGRPSMGNERDSVVPEGVRVRGRRPAVPAELVRV